MIRVLHVTDPHLFAHRSGELRGTETFASLSMVLDHYRDSNWHADVAMVTGDLVHDDSKGAYEHFRDQLGGLDLPVCCLPGNHDVRHLMQELLTEPPFRYCQSLESGNWLIASVDSCVEGQPGGHVGDAEFEHLDSEIASTDADHVMVCLHHPPVAMGSTWLDSVGMDNGDEFMRRIGTSGKVRLVLFGHVHQAYDAQHGGIRVVGTPSTCRQFKRGSPEFAIDDNPPAYRRISLYTDGRFEHDLVWVNNESV